MYAHDSKNKADKDKDDEKLHPLPILILSAIANVFTALLRYAIKIIIVRDDYIHC